MELEAPSGPKIRVDHTPNRFDSSLKGDVSLVVAHEEDEVPPGVPM